METITSKLYSLNWRDLLKGLGWSVGTALLYVLQQVVDAWMFHGGMDIFTWAQDPANIKNLAMAAIGAGIFYLAQKFGTPQQIIKPLEPGIIQKLIPNTPAEKKEIADTKK